MINKAKQIREFKEANPSAPINKIADACNATVAYVYQVLHKMQNKKAKPVTPVEPTNGQKTLRKEIERLHKEIEQWKNLSDLNERRVASFMEQVRQAKLHHNGLEYVISYLESRLGIKEQDGTTV